MAIKPTMQLVPLLTTAKIRLRMNQTELGRALGASQRTAQRWEAGRSHPGAVALCTLAKLLFPSEPALAVEAAAHAGETLESLGLVAPPRLLSDSPRDAIDLVVCAVAESADMSPRIVRAMLAVAFHRLGEVGLSLEAARQALPLAPPTT